MGGTRAVQESSTGHNQIHNFSIVNAHRSRSPGSVVQSPFRGKTLWSVPARAADVRAHMFQIYNSAAAPYFSYPVEYTHEYIGDTVHGIEVH